MQYLIIIVSGIVVMLVSLSGKLLMYGSFRSVIQKNLKFLISFAIGVFSATLFLMIKETSHIEATIGQIAIIAALGALTLEVFQSLIPESHHHHGSDKKECCEHDEVKKKINPKRILFGDAAHNIGDGIMLVSSYLISLHAGLSVTLGILIHELVQEISEFFILKEAGYSTKKALISNFIVSGTVFIGIIFGILVAKATDYSHLLIAFSSGGIFYIIVRDLIPHTIERIKHDGKIFTHFVYFVMGIIMMLLSVHIIPHTHDIHHDAQDKEISYLSKKLT